MEQLACIGVNRDLGTMIGLECRLCSAGRISLHLQECGCDPCHCQLGNSEASDYALLIFGRDLLHCHSPVLDIAEEDELVRSHPRILVSLSYDSQFHSGDDWLPLIVESAAGVSELLRATVDPTTGSIS